MATGDSPCAGAEGSPEGNEDAGGWLRWSLARAIAVGSDRSSRNCREKFPSGRLRDLERLPSRAPCCTYASPCRLHGTSPYLFDTRGGSTGGASGAADGEFSGFTLFRPGGRQTVARGASPAGVLFTVGRSGADVSTQGRDAPSAYALK